MRLRLGGAVLVVGVAAAAGFYGDERWATDPMSKDAYEINQPGLTVGFFRKFLPSGLEFDLPATVYRQEEQIDHLFTSGLFDSATVVIYK